MKVRLRWGVVRNQELGIKSRGWEDAAGLIAAQPKVPRGSAGSRGPWAGGVQASAPGAGAARRDEPSQRSLLSLTAWSLDVHICVAPEAMEKLMPTPIPAVCLGLPQ